MTKLRTENEAPLKAALHSSSLSPDLLISHTPALSEGHQGGTAGPVHCQWQPDSFRLSLVSTGVTISGSSTQP
eukprot:3575587-Rhodomonas_salina.1